MTVFNCIITQKSDVTLDNIPQWKKLLISRSTPSLPPAYKKILLRYEVSSVPEYIELVTDALKNDSVGKINDLYEKNKKKELESVLKKEKETLKTKIEDSISKLSDNTIIRMLTEEDEEDATKLYIMFKETMNEDIEKARDYTQDFILKNIMFGIFINDVLAGFVIIHYSKSFKIDFQTEKVPTFYIQELLIHPSYRGKKFSKFLLEYCIYRCPKDKMYVSLMTMPDNIALQKVAESVGFTKQDTPSGDSKHSLLMIKNMDKLENSIPRSVTSVTKVTPVTKSSHKTAKDCSSASLSKSPNKTTRRSIPKTSSITSKEQ